MFEIYRDKASEWRWSLKAGNGQIIADSGEGYTRKEDALRAIHTVKDLVAAARIIGL